MSTVEDRDVADQHVAAQFERNGLVAQPGGRKIRFKLRRAIVRAPPGKPAHLIEQLVVAHQPAAVDHAVAGDGNVS